MRSLASLRYVLALLVTSQRWGPPAIVLIGLIAWIWITPPVGLDTIRITLVALFGLASWLGHATGSVEEPGQELISVSCRGSATRVLLAKWLVAASLAAVFPVILVVGAYLLGLPDPSRAVFTGGQAAAAVLALLAVAAAGAALGILVVSALPGSPGWAAAVLVVVTLAQAAPWMIPVPILAAFLPGPGEPFGAGFYLGLGVAGVLTAAFLVAARALRRPSP